MTPRLGQIWIYPLKSFDPHPLVEAAIGPGGGLANDRRWALFDGDDRVVNGKRQASLHRIRARFSPAVDEVELWAPDAGGARFRFAEPAPLEAWLGARFGFSVTLREEPRSGFPDDLAAWGPTVVSQATLEAVCRWFPGMSLESARRRFRANLELCETQAFWEDRLFGPPGLVVPFKVGAVRFEGTNPCQRCPVPSRDPDDGTPWSGFQKAFAEARRAELPTWTPVARFDHFYRLAVNTRVAPAQAGRLLAIGDAVTIE